MKIVFLVIFIIFNINLSGQYWKISSDRVNYSGHYDPYKVTAHKNLQQFINHKYPNLKRHINNRNKLRPLKLIQSDEHELFFVHEDKLEVNIKFKEIKYYAYHYFYPKDSSEEFSHIIDKDDAPFGVNSEDTMYAKISDIEINQKKVGDLGFQDLYNPNILFTKISIRPIEAYLSNNNKFVYIYIFGTPNSKFMEFNNIFELTFMAKLIYSIEGNYIGRIVERGDCLNYCGFDVNPWFIGF